MKFYEICLEGNFTRFDFVQERMNASNRLRVDWNDKLFINENNPTAEEQINVAHIVERATEII